MTAEMDNNPFVGLRPFDSTESLLFFGRQDQTLALLQRLHQHQFVAVTGSSGSGKSSLILAGLIPTLKAGFLVKNSDRWVIAMMRPGQSPLTSLAEALLKEAALFNANTSLEQLTKAIHEQGVDAVLDLLQPLWSANTNFFLLVDQFEELFRFSFPQNNFQQKDEAKEFVNILLALSAQKGLPVYVVITMRSDFIGDCSLIYGLPEALNESQYIVPRLDRLQLKNTIEGPVKLYRGKINAALTARLLNDVQLVKDELPLLQHALMRIWDHEKLVSRTGELDLEDYHRIGGIENALSIHADEAFEGLINEQQQLAVKLFQALTAVDEHGRKIRRPTRLGELELTTGASREHLLSVMEQFIQGGRFFLVLRVLPIENDLIIDISHESLIRQWRRLNQWVDDEANASRTLLRLSDTMVRLSRDAKLFENQEPGLLDGMELQIALHWLQSVQPNPTWARRYISNYDQTRDFIRLSENAWYASLAKQKKEQQRKQRNRKLLIAGLVFVILLTSSFAFFVYQNNKADKKQLALNYWNNSQGAQKQFLQLTGLHFVAEAIRLDPERRSKENMLIDGTSCLPLAYLEAILPFDAFVLAVAFQPGSNNLALAGNDGSIRMFDTQSGKAAGTVMQHESLVTSLDFSPDGQQLLSASNDKTARVWDIASGKNRFSLLHPDRVTDAFYSTDGRHFITVCTDSVIRIWESATGQGRDSIHHTERITTATFSPDGKEIIGIDAMGYVLRWNLSSRQKNILNPEEQRPSDAASISFSRDSTRFLTVGSDPEVGVWDAKTNQLLFSIPQPSEVRCAIFSPADRYIVTAGKDGYVRFWDPVTQRQTGAELKHEGPAFQVAFNDTGSQLATTGWDKKVRIWQMSTASSAPLPLIFPHDNSVNFATLSKDGAMVVTASDDHTARVWDVSTQKLLALLPHPDMVRNAFFSADGSQVYTTCEDGVLRNWIWKMGKKQVPTQLGEGVAFAALSMDGKLIAGYGSDYRISLFNASNLQLRDSFTYWTQPNSLSLSPDGNTILVGGSDSTARMLDLKSKKTVAVFRHEDAVNSAVFSPNGKAVLTAGMDSSARLWDISTQRQIGLTIKLSRSINTAAFSPDGRWIVTTCLDGTVRLWDAILQKELAIVLQDEAGFNNAVFSPDNRHLLVAGVSGSARVVEIAADLDIPPYLFQLQAKALTGTELNLVTGETQCLLSKNWKALQLEYMEKGKEHAKFCRYPAYNSWRRFFSSEAKGRAKGPL